jgi:type VI protein secretion system component Hcp
VRKILFATMAASGALLAATASLAASDYYLKIEGVDGDTAAASQAKPIELQSWSFGAAQAGVASPRDAASGLPTGKRQHKPMTVTKPIETSAPLLRESPTRASAGATTAAAAAAPATPATAEMQTVNFSVPEPGDESTAELARLCASGKHIKSATLSSPNGRYQLSDAVITSCAVTGNERRYEFRGHVTLMK